MKSTRFILAAVFCALCVAGIVNAAEESEDVTAVHRPSRPGAPGTEQISLTVAGDLAEAPAGAYRVESDVVSLGELDFLPVGGTGRDRRLEAVITRIV